MVDLEQTRMDFIHMYDRAMNHGDFGPAEALCKSSFVCRNPYNEVSGIEGIKRSVNFKREALEGMKFEIKATFVTDDHITVIWNLSGRHIREMYNVPPSGKFVCADGISVHELVDGKSIGEWSCNGVREEMQKLYEQAKVEGSLPAAA